MTAFDGVGDGLRREDEEGSSRTGNAITSQHDKRTRGRCNKRRMRDDDPTTSWRDKTTRGSTMRRRDDERAARREATQQPAGATRGREGYMGHNKRTRRCDARTSWRDELTRGWRNERTVRGNVTTSWRDKTTRGLRNERTTRGDATTSWQDKMTPGRCDERRHNLVLVRIQTEAPGQVTAMVVARIEQKPEQLCAGEEFQEVGYVVQKGLRARRHLKD